MNTENIKTSDLVQLAAIQSKILADCGYKYHDDPGPRGPKGPPYSSEHSPIITPEGIYDIQIDKVYKDGEWLCFKTGNVVRRVKTEITKEILKLLME